MKVLYPGRFQPFHAGHAAIIEQLKEEGLEVVVAIRDTDIAPSNPYSIEERKILIRSKFPEIEIITIPDIEIIAHGRRPGWKFREVKLSKDLERISGSRIRDN